MKIVIIVLIMFALGASICPGYNHESKTCMGTAITYCSAYNEPTVVTGTLVFTCKTCETGFETNTAKTSCIPTTNQKPWSYADGDFLLNFDVLYSIGAVSYPNMSCVIDTQIIPTCIAGYYD